MTHTPRKLSPVAKAYERCKEGRDALHRIARCMETTQDKCGIVWERWVLPNGVSLVVYATPDWWDLFVPLSKDPTIAATLEALTKLAGERP